MNEIILAKYGEIALKGLNKHTFEDILLKNIRKKLKSLGYFKYTKLQSTIYIVPENSEVDLDEALNRLSKIFGIAAICKAAVLKKDFDDIAKKSVEYLKDVLPYAKTFKVQAKRADKAFPLKSPEICREIGGILISNYPNLNVDVYNPEITVTIEVRDTNAYVYSSKVEAAGGLPVGSSGKAMLLISGGIDSPVAGYMMAKRGISISAIHFISPPYTSERARLKVENLCEKLTEYCGDITFYCVPFTEIQENIKRSCPEEYFTIIMRRIMMQISQIIAENDNSLALITGESVGQVASQTLKAIACTDAVCTMPVLRPVIGMDKTEIVNISRKIDTFDISIQPFEDCCTVLTPKHPKTKPNLDEVQNVHNSLDFSEMVNKAVELVEKITIKMKD